MTTEERLGDDIVRIETKLAYIEDFMNKLQAIAVEQRKAFEAVRRDAAAHFGDSIEHFLRQELTEEQKRAYQTTILGEVKL